MTTKDELVRRYKEMAEELQKKLLPAEEEPGELDHLVGKTITVKVTADTSPLIKSLTELGKKMEELSRTMSPISVRYPRKNGKSLQLTTAGTDPEDYLPQRLAYLSIEELRAELLLTDDPDIRFTILQMLIELGED